VPKIKVAPENLEFEIDEDTDILSFLRSNDCYVKSSCGGHASCGDCVIKILTGDENLSKAPFEETKLLGNVFHITKERLSCQTKITGDVVIDISSHCKNADEERLLNKTRAMKKSIQLKKGAAGSTQKGDLSQEDDKKWYKHWEKDKEENMKKDFGGKKRPKRPDYKKK